MQRNTVAQEMGPIMKSRTLPALVSEVLRWVVSESRGYGTFLLLKRSVWLHIYACLPPFTQSSTSPLLILTFAGYESSVLHLS